MLKKELTLYDRDNEGKLIAQEVTLELSKQDTIDYTEYVGEKVMVTPMTRGELKKLFGLAGKETDVKPETDKDSDAELIVSNCFDPQYTMEELTHAKPVIVRSIVRTIFLESGVKLDDFTGSKTIVENDEFGKN